MFTCSSRANRSVALLLLAVLLTLSLTALLPTVAAADQTPKEIDEFGYQSLAGANVLDDSTSLRFLFTVGSLAYDGVGVILSKSVETPTYGAALCYTYETETVYRSIAADGATRVAPAGRYWVAAKLTGIPHSYFDGALYARAYVRNGEAVRYSDPVRLTVCAALGHVHVLPPWDAEGSATMQTVGTLTWYCAGCDLDVTENGVVREPMIYDSAHASGPFVSGTSFVMSKSLGDIRGEDHFYPTAGNPEGNDLWFEYSLLWNKSLENWDLATALAEIKIISMRNGSNYREFYYLYTRNNNEPFATSGDCPFEGHFDFSTSSPGDKSCVVYGPDAGYADPKIRLRSDTPYVYDDNWMTANGWHRIGVRVHQEAANSGGSVVYSGYSELYIDGVLVWRINSDVSLLKNKKLLLFTAAVIDDELICTDNDNALVQMRFDRVGESSSSVYVAVGDIAWTCGTGFQTQVEREPFPEARTLVLDEDVTVNAPFYYRPKTDPPADSFSIATWNIGHFSNGKSKNTKITDGNYAAASVQYKTYINDVLGADIICLNEYSALFTPSHNASDLFDAYTEVGFEGEQRRYSCNALYSKLPLSNVTVHEFACNAGVDITYTNAVEATDYYYITGELTLGGETVTIVAAHLAYDENLYDVYPYIDTVCQNEMRELIDTFADTDRVLILGDWNAFDYSYFDLFADAGYTLGNRNEIPTCTGSRTNDLEWSVDNMVAKGLVINDFRGEPTMLSDHIAVIATITLAD